MRAKVLRLAKANASPRPRSLLAAAIVLAALPSSQARSQAQVTLDVSKITCDQFSGYKIASPDNIALWLHGYFNGKKGNTIIDTQKLSAESHKLVYYCVTHPNMSVMQAVNELFGTSK